MEVMANRASERASEWKVLDWRCATVALRVLLRTAIPFLLAPLRCDRQASWKGVRGVKWLPRLGFEFRDAT